MKLFKRYIHSLLLIGISLLIFGCGGGSSATPTTTITGTVFAGPASGSSVTVKNASGVLVAGPVVTAGDGSYTIAIPTAALAADLVFEATGGSFTDEATAAAATLGTFTAHADAGSLTSASSVTVDPSSTIIQKLMAGGRTRAAAESVFNAAFGYTPDLSVRPAFANQSSASTTPQRLAGLRAAAFSQLTKDLLNDSSKQSELVLALADDLSDGSLDGLRSGGGAVTTAYGTAIPVDIGNRFARAMMTYQTSTLNRSKLAMDKIGALPFVKKALTDSYIVEYIPGTMAASAGKTSFTIRLTNRSTGTAASGKAVTLRPYMYMATKSHTTPMETPVDNGDGTYACTVYYVMSTAMNGISMGVWELKVTIGGTESAYFYPDVAMPMGSTALAKLTGIADAIMGLAGVEKRTWFLFNDGLSAGMGGAYTFRLFVATKEMGSSLSFPAVKVGDALNNEAGTPWTVASMVVEASTDKTTWLTATDLGNGHWSVAGLTGLTAGTSGKIYVRLTVNGEQKSTDGLAVAAANGYQTFTVTPGGM